MIALRASIFCKFYVCRNPTITITDFLEDGKTEYHFDYGQIESTRNLASCSISSFQTCRLYVLTHNRFCHSILFDSIFCGVKLSMTKYRNLNQIQKNFTTQNYLGLEVYLKYYKNKPKLWCLLLSQQLSYFITIAFFDMVLSYYVWYKLFVITMTFFGIDRNSSYHSLCIVKQSSP